MSNGVKVILLKDVKKVGRSGDILVLSDGYAKNFLIPQKLAVIASSEALANAAKIEKTRQKHELENNKLAQNLAQKLEKRHLQFAVAVDASGHLYAGLKESEILSKIREGEGGLPVGAKLLDYAPIKMIGNWRVRVQLSPANIVELNLAVNKK